MREVRSVTEQSVEGLYGDTHSNTSLNDTTVFGGLKCRYPYEGFFQVCGVLLAMLTIYGALLAAIGEAVRLPGPVWAVCIVWICAQAAGFLAAKVGLSPTVGMVAVGLLLRNVPGQVLKGLPFMWSFKLRMAGLVLVLLQCGLRPHVQVPGQTGQMPAVALALLPQVAEAVALGLCLGLWLHLNVFMAVSGALILATVCPALIGVVTQQWHCSRLGTRKGVPVWMQSAARWNVLFGIAGFSLCLGLAVPHHNLGLQIAHGPVSIAVGLAAGVLLGFVCALTMVWTSPLRRAVALLTFGELLAFCGMTWHFPAAGFLANLTMAGLASLVWRQSSLSQLCNRLAPGASEKTVQQPQGILEVVWAGAIQPLVMGLAGASIYFPSMPSGLALRALALTAVGLSVRGCTALAVLLGGGFSCSESTVMTLVWLSGGSIQATLAAAPLELVYLYQQISQHYIAQAEVIALVGVFSILLGATIAWLSGAILGPVLLTKQQEDLPVAVQPGSPEEQENNPFLSSLQQSGISVTGHGSKGLAMQLLRKTGSVAVHGNPFSDDDGRHDKSPLLIGSVDSSYSFETPRRVASHNPFADAKHEQYHTLHDVRRITSGDSTSSLGPNRSSQSVPALMRGHTSFKDDELTGDERRRTTETLLWENEPMSTAAAIGTPFSNRRRTSTSSLGAASCVWDNEPMSAAAALSFSPRLALQRVSEVSEGVVDPSDQLPPLGRYGLAGVGVQQVLPIRVPAAVSSSRSGVPWLRPQRPAPSMQRSNSFPSQTQNEDFLEYEVTSALTLKETPRSQHRQDVQRARELWERQSQQASATDTSGSPHVSFALPASPGVQQSTGDADAVMMTHLQSNTSAEVAAVIASIMPTQHVNLQMHADATDVGHAIDPTAAVAPETMFDSASNNAGRGTVDVMSRHASVMTLYESAHSGALSDSGDVANTNTALQ